MIIDNLLVNGLKKEFRDVLLDGRIEKIFQPDKDCFVFHIWKKNVFKLLFSLNPETYRACITNTNYTIPNQHSTFCMHLKKTLESGNIVEINQINFDRIFEFKIESFDNVRDKVNLFLIVELTGKYSNMILLNEDYNVIGCYKQIDDSQNEERQILLGKRYYPITNKNNKLELQNLNFQLLEVLFTNSDLTLKKFLVKNILGISTHTAQLIIDDLKITDKKVSTYSDFELNQLYDYLRMFSQKIQKDEINIQFFENNGNPDFHLVNEQSEQSISEQINNYYQKKADEHSFLLLRNELNKFVEKNLERISERIKQQNEVLINSQQAEHNKQLGDLLFSNIHSLPEKAESVKLENYYDENNSIIEIKLDENLSISENAQKLFKKYNKLRNSKEIAQKMLDDYQKEFDYFDQVITSIDNSENLNDLKQIEQELIEEKYLIKNEKKNNVKKVNPERKNLLSIISPSGLEILVGKNNKQNDFLTTKFASENDIWLHTRLIPGSHVLLRTENGQKEFRDEDLIEAAKLAAKFSKAKYSSNVCVIYTKIKNIKKPPHSKPGYVIYSKEKAVYVTPEISKQ